MTKTVIETDYKFYLNHDDAKSDSNYFIESVDVEGGSPPSQIKSKSMTGNFRLKSFTREIHGAKFLEYIYLRTN